MNRALKIYSMQPRKLSRKLKFENLLWGFWKYVLFLEEKGHKNKKPIIALKRMAVVANLGGVHSLPLQWWYML